MSLRRPPRAAVPEAPSGIRYRSLKTFASVQRKATVGGDNAIPSMMKRSKISRPEGGHLNGSERE